MRRITRTFTALAAIAAVATSSLGVAPASFAASSEIVYEIDFESGSGGWFPFGGASVADTTDHAHGGTHSLVATNRTQGFEGPAIDLGAVLRAGTTYDFSAWVLMPVAGTIGLTMKRTDAAATDHYEGIANTAVAANTWTEITGTYGFTDAVALNLYAESAILTDIYIDDVSVASGAPPPPPPPLGVVISTDFESGLAEWTARAAQGTPTIASSADAHESTQAVQVTDRTGQGDGVGRDVTGVMVQGGNYEVTAWVKMATGSGNGDISLTMRRTTAGADSFDTIRQVSGITSGRWVQITGTYRMAAHDAAFIYFETAYPDGTTDSFLVDDVVVESVGVPTVQDITPIKDTVEFKLGAAIDSRETIAPASELLSRHFDQVTPENHMKPEAWYDADRNFGIHPEATAIMDYAQANGIDVYGHTLVWHSQTPAWFFETDDGTPLTDSAVDQEILRNRMRTHIFAVAEALSSEYGLFGSDTNPLRAWDVVNEVISDGATDDGMRRSRWYEVLGENFVDLAFQFADEAFNATYAAPGTDRPVMLSINDYSTEQDAKRQRLHGLVERLLSRGVPVDAVGHQFHVSLYTPVEALGDAIDAFEDLAVRQVVSELDVTTGTPVTEALLIDQGYYFRDAFRIFRAHAASLYSVSVWGLTDNRSWLAASGDPLLFNAELQAKPAYYGAIDGELDPRQRSAVVFMADGDTSVDSPTWDRVPLHEIDGDTAFQLRWRPDSLTAYVEVADGTADPADQLTFAVGDATYSVGRDGAGDVAATVVETSAGYTVVVDLPLAGAAAGGLVPFDVRVTDGATTVGWNDEGAIGTLSLVEPLSFTATVGAATAPTIDGTVDAVWANANSVATDTIISGSSDGASAVVKTLWEGDNLYVLAEVTDATPDLTASDPWMQDSVEIFVDTANAKSGPYRSSDTQIRINSANAVSFGIGDLAMQQARLTSATTLTATGYTVEASVNLLGLGGVDSIHGMDFQINDGTAGSRSSVRTWGDPTGISYQSTARWGVTQLVAGDTEPICDQTVGYSRGSVRVDEGVLCLEPGAFVRGSISVTSGASLVADGATVLGAVRTSEAATVSIVDSLIVGSVTVERSSDGVALAGDTIIGSVVIIDNEVTDTIVVSNNGILGRLRCRGNTPAPTNDGSPNWTGAGAGGQCRALV